MLLYSFLPFYFMKKAFITSLIVTLAPLSVLAVTTGSNVRNTFIIQSQSGKTQTGTTRSWVTVSGEIVRSINQANINAIKDVARPESRLETAAERQRQRQADLDKQHKEQQEQADRQREIKAVYDAMKKAEEESREKERQKRQPNETIEAYCSRAMTQGFLNTKWKVNTTEECITKLKNLEKVGKKIIENRLKENMENKRLGQRLKKLCTEEFIKTGKVSEFCTQIFSQNTGSSRTQSGGTLTTSR